MTKALKVLVAQASLNWCRSGLCGASPVHFVDSTIRIQKKTKIFNRFSPNQRLGTLKYIKHNVHEPHFLSSRVDIL